VGQNSIGANTDSFNELQHTARGKLKSAQRRSAIIASCWQQAELF
jgi:hypothetical protein